MSRFNQSLLAGVAMLALSVSASAQYRRDDNRYGGGYGDRYSNGYGRGNVPTVDRVLAQLDNSQSYLQNGHDHKYLDRARNDLYRFRENWYRGRFDKGRLDGAIDNIHKVVDSRWLNPRERASLSRSMWDLRELRARGGDWGDRRRPY